MKALLRIGAILLGAGLLLAAAFFHWSAGREAELRGGSEVVMTAKGAVEVARRGSGPPILILHGLTGGYDQGLLFAQGAQAAGFEAISISRPGYLRTPLSTGVTFDDQADACAALLDALHLGRVAVIGVSAGGLPAIALAIRHPDRVRALILLSGVTAHFSGKPSPRAGRGLGPFSSNPGAALGALMVRLMPDFTRGLIFQVTTQPKPGLKEAFLAAIREDPSQGEGVRRLVDGVYPVDRRRAGVENDLAQLFSPGDIPLERIGVPTLLVHGDADRILPFAGARQAASRIPGATLDRVPGAGHIVQLGPGAAEAEKRMVDFLTALF